MRSLLPFLEGRVLTDGGLAQKILKWLPVVINKIVFSLPKQQPQWLLALSAVLSDKTLESLSHCSKFNKSANWIVLSCMLQNVALLICLLVALCKNSLFLALDCLWYSSHIVLVCLSFLLVIVEFRKKIQIRLFRIFQSILALLTFFILVLVWNVVWLQ